jgi:hypothetical protein
MEQFANWLVMWLQKMNAIMKMGCKNAKQVISFVRLNHSNVPRELLLSQIVLQVIIVLKVQKQFKNSHALLELLPRPQTKSKKATVNLAH